jgi:hypothetical protein
MTAANKDFLFEQGATFIRLITWLDKNKQPVPLAGYTAKMQVRVSESSPTVLLELTDTNGKLSINPDTGTITIILDALTTKTFTWRSGVYDLVLTAADGTTRRLIEGEITVSPATTR